MRYLREFFKDLAGLFRIIKKEYLCDTCEFDYGNACVRPERPNARSCPDYKKRG